MQRLRNRLIGFLTLLRSRTFAATSLLAVLALVIGWAATLTNTIAIYDEQSVLLERTFEQNPQNILADNGIRTAAADLVQFTGISNGYGEICITRAFPVTLTADGKTQTFSVTGGTVSDLLSKLEITLGAQDLLYPQAQQPLSENLHILLQRVRSCTRKEIRPIPQQTTYRLTPLLPEGKSRILEYGTDGEEILVYEQRILDGVVTQEQLLSRTLSKEARPRILLQGGKRPVSPLDFGVPLDEKGAPLSYSKVFTQQIATGYNGGRHAWGASGEWLSAGSVAVHPDKIPYGTKLYIASADGDFVYGFAVAADTGTGLLDDIIDVDLYYDSYLESCLNGRKIVSIYVL